MWTAASPDCVDGHRTINFEVGSGSMKSIIRLLAAGLFALAGTAAAGDMPLGRGDIVKVTVFANPDLSLETKVGESGNISYPLLGEVPVAGLATVEAERRIAKALENGGFVKKPQVNVLVTSFQSQQVSVLGLVNRPGRYPMDGRRTLIDVLALAGGVSVEGGDTAVLIRTRDGKTTKESIDLPMMMRSADLSQNLDLVGGDVIYIERAPKFYIYGEVQRPGVYRLERNMTVIQALSAGGGLNVRGTERGVRVKRLGTNGEMEEVRVKHGDMLRPDDVVYVQESLF